MTNISNWAGNVRFSAREYHRPESLDQLRRIVAASTRAKTLGSRHSFSTIADTTGDLIDVTTLPRTIEIDEENPRVTVSAGTRYGELAPVIDRAGWALKNTGSLPHITIGGATATGTHGSGVRNGTQSSHVAALELVTPDGELATIRRGDDGFDGAVIHLGALGVATRLTLDLVPTFEVRQGVYEGISWSDTIEKLDDVLAAAYSVSLFTSWAGDDFGLAWLKSTTGELPPEVLGRPMTSHDIGLAGGEPTFATAQAGVPVRWYQGLPHFRLEFTPSNGDELQTEYFVPRSAAREALLGVRALAERIEPLLHITELRTIAADGLWLSGSGDRDALAVHFTWKNRPAEVRALLPSIEEVLLPLGGRPHWGKVYTTRELDAAYPRLDEFRGLVERFDPRGKFRNEHLNRVLG